MLNGFLNNFMTIERTRQLLGGKIANLSDSDVLILIQKTNKSIDALFYLSVKQAIANKKEVSIQ